MKRNLAAVALLMVGCNCARQTVVDPQPLDQYEIWDRYEETYVARYGHDLKALYALGVGRAFALMAEDVPSWWCFYVQPGVYAAPRCVLYTAAGAYESDQVMFTSGGGQAEVYDQFPLTVDTRRFESVPYGPGGEWRVVAFAHFPEQPQGEVLKWEVYP